MLFFAGIWINIISKSRPVKAVIRITNTFSGFFSVVLRATPRLILFVLFLPRKGQNHAVHGFVGAAQASMDGRITDAPRPEIRRRMRRIGGKRYPFLPRAKKIQADSPVFCGGKKCAQMP
jgi:hypothetical protein